jgi:hypothetical protein
VVSAQDVEAEVESGGDARRGEDLSLVDEQDVGIDPDPRVRPLEVLGVAPVGRGAQTVEETRCGEDVGAGANGEIFGGR